MRGTIGAITGAAGAADGAFAFGSDSFTTSEAGPASATVSVLALVFVVRGFLSAAASAAFGVKVILRFMLKIARSRCGDSEGLRRSFSKSAVCVCDQKVYSRKIEFEWAQNSGYINVPPK